MSISNSHGPLWNPKKDRSLIRKLTHVFNGVFSDREAVANQGVSAFEDASGGSDDSFTGGFGFQQYQKQMLTEERSKAEKLDLYRQMEQYDEIGQAIETICDYAINYNEDNEIANLIIHRQDLRDNVNKKDNIRKEWKYIKDEVLKLEENAWHWLSSFITTGELFFEKVIDPKDPKKGVRRIKKLVVDTTFPVWDEDKIVGYTSRDLKRDEMVLLSPAMIAYTNSGKFLNNTETGEKIVLSFLEHAKKSWRQLVWIEDSIIIYRVTRAPERRVFNIATGNMPKGKAEAYMKRLMKEYKQRLTYDQKTGTIGGQTHIQHMLSDFWFARPNDSEGSSVDTLAGGQNLGELEDLDYFLKKLYRALKIPEVMRFDAESRYNTGRVGDVTYQEVKFQKLVNRIMQKFVHIIWDVFKTHLELKGIWKQYNLTDNDLKIDFHANNLFEEARDAEIQGQRLDHFGNVSSYVGEYFARRTVMKKFLRMTDEEIDENNSELEKEKREGQDFDDGGGLGGGF